LAAPLDGFLFNIVEIGVQNKGRRIKTDFFLKKRREVARFAPEITPRSPLKKRD
jgi:hypothetical protein